MRSLKKGWTKIDWNKWQTKIREQEIENTVNKLAPAWVNNKKASINLKRKKNII